ncbi:hypothetical protein [Tardiphaga sp. 619_E2_N8_5]|uniref:hypothetical protein n=1 Tax=unclassified Tardiphaga TaxID=2631404 RepID=UPI003F28EBCD
MSELARRRSGSLRCAIGSVLLGQFFALLSFMQKAVTRMLRLAKLIRKFRFLPLAGEGMGLRQPVHAQDLAVGAICATASVAAANKTYELPGGEVITYRETAGRIFDSLNQPRWIISAPPLLWQTAFAIFKLFFPMLMRRWAAAWKRI